MFPGSPDYLAISARFNLLERKFNGSPPNSPELVLDGSHVFIIGLLPAAGRPWAVTDITLELVPHWKQGEKRSFEMVKTRKRAAKGALLQVVTIRVPVTIEVLTAGKGGFVLAWVQGEAKLEDPKMVHDPSLQQTLRLAGGVRTVVELDSEGNFVGVQNWEELKERAGRLAAADTEYKKPGKDLTLLKAVESKVRRPVCNQGAGRGNMR